MTRDPIVMLHGVGANRSIWRSVVPLIAEDRLVITPDLPGFGDSPALDTRFDLDAVATTLADDLAQGINEPFDLVGNSLGGAVALVLAERRPELIRRLVLAAPAGLAPRPRPLSALAGHVVGPVIKARRIVGTPLAGSPTARRLLLWGTVASPQKLAPADARAMLQASRGARSIGSAVTAVLNADLRSSVQDAQVPVGLLWGEHDRVIPARSVLSLREFIDGIPLELIPAAGHVPQIERPDEFVRALERLLTRLDRQRP